MDAPSNANVDGNAEEKLIGDLIEVTQNFVTRPHRPHGYDCRMVWHIYGGDNIFFQVSITDLSRSSS